jgi:hypothetical protein
LTFVTWTRDPTVLAIEDDVDGDEDVDAADGVSIKLDRAGSM